MHTHLVLILIHANLPFYTEQQHAHLPFYIKTCKFIFFYLITLCTLTFFILKHATRHSYMLPIADHTAGPNGLTFFVDTHGWPGDVKG